jgi:hypothetical protein
MEATSSTSLRSRCRFATDEAGWRDFLPPEWRDSVVVPLHFIHHREYEMSAARCFGYDEDDAACY